MATSWLDSWRCLPKSRSTSRSGLDVLRLFGDSKRFQPTFSERQKPNKSEYSCLDLTMLGAASCRMVCFFLGYRSYPMLDLSHFIPTNWASEIAAEHLETPWGYSASRERVYLFQSFSAAVRVLLRVLHPFFMSWACHKIRKPQSHHFPINILQV